MVRILLIYLKIFMLMSTKTETDKIYSRFFRQLVFLGTLLAIGIMIFSQLRSLLGAFLGAITLYVVVREPFFRLTEKHKWKTWAGALVVVLSMTVILLGIGFLVFEVTAKEIPNVDTSKIVREFNSAVDKINNELGFKVLSSNIIGESTSVISKAVSSLLSTTYSFAINVFLMLVILFFMFMSGRKMEKKILEYQPFRGKSFDMVNDKIQGMIYSNAVGIPVVMLCQGIAAGLIYWAFGINNVVFWAFLTALCGLIPMIGTSLVSVPLGIFLISGGEVWHGVVLMACGLFVIANVDNLVRIILLKKVANTHPLIVIFGVIMGIPMFGFWGIIFGPLLLSCFLLLINIYYHEFGLLKKGGGDDGE